MSAIPHTAVDLQVRQGTVFERTVWLENADGSFRNFATDTVRGQVRRRPDDATVIASFTCTPVNHPETSAANEAVRVRIGALTTKTISPDTYVYDIEVVPAAGEDHAFLLFAGTLVVTGGVTKP